VRSNLEAELLQLILHGLAANRLHRITERPPSRSGNGKRFNIPTEIDRIAARLSNAARPIGEVLEGLRFA
jgi:hypothetical protein